MHILLHALNFVCHCTEHKLPALQFGISEENALNAMTQQFITAKISGCALKQGSETYSSLNQSYLQPGLQSRSPEPERRSWAFSWSRSSNY